MEKNRRLPALNKPKKTSIVRMLSTNNSGTRKSFHFPKMENLSSSNAFRIFTSGPFWTTESQDYSNYSNSSYFYLNESDYFSNMSSITADSDKKITCQWVTAQHNMFQFANICFLSAFIVPRNYKCGILSFRIALFISFIVSAIWAGVHFCAVDWFIWSSSLAVMNGVHVIVLTFKFLPPALSLELTELYIRVFKPLKVSKKHFKELTKEACLLSLAPGECYAIEEVTPAAERLSILLKGRFKVSCNGTFLHSISCYQFIDSPEWQANKEANGTRFQVTIIAEEDCLCMTWQRIKLDRILRHKPLVKYVLNNLIGKDITHKMYSLNEQVGRICTTEALSKAAREDHWRRSMNRSVSVDAVDTGTRGHLRSSAWKHAEKIRKSSTHSESETTLLGQQPCWYSVVASQFPADYPFFKQDDGCTSQDDEKEPMLRKEAKQSRFEQEAWTLQNTQQKQQQLQIISQYTKSDSIQTLPLLNVGNNQLMNSQPVALIPVIVPIMASAMSTSSAMTAAASSIRAASLKRQRGVKFDETCL